MTQFAVGQALGRYRLDAVLGRGGMAEVFRATDTRLGRVVAVKVILAAYALEPEFVARFLREARLLAGLEHPNILPVYDFGEERGTPYLVMPFLAAGTLGDRMTASSERPLAGGHVTAWVQGLASALDAAHRAGVLHRDVKPGNVLLGGDDRALLADFGLAKMHQSATRLTTAGMVVGTPLYMAPELARGGAAAPATDAYALAVLAFELVTGSPPFRGENALALLHQHVHTPPPRPTSQSPELPAALDPVFERALAKDPAQRFPDCRSFAAAFCAALGLAAPPAASALPISARTRALSERETRATPSLRRGWPLAAAIAVVGIAAAWLLWPRAELEPAPQAALSAPAASTTATEPIPPSEAPPPEVVSPEPRMPKPQVKASAPVATVSAAPAAEPDENEEASEPILRGQRLDRADFERLLASAARRGAGPRAVAAEAAEVYARGGLAYLEGDQPAARRAIEDLLAGGSTGVPMLEGLIGGLRSFAPAGLVDWHVALAYGDARREANRLLDAYEAVHPGDVSAQVGRAVLAVLEGDPRRAIELAEAAYATSPKARLAGFLAQQHLATGAPAESLRWWEIAAAGEGTEAGFAAMQGAKVARQLGQPVKARELQQLACQRGVPSACIDRAPTRRQRPR